MLICVIITAYEKENTRIYTFCATVKRMSLRMRLVLSYVILLVALTGGYILLTEFFITGTLTQRNVTTAQKCVHHIADVNYTLSRDILTSYGEQIVIAAAESASYQLAAALKDEDNYTYEYLRAVPAYRVVATQAIESFSGVAGYVDVYDTNGISVWHPNTTVEGRNFSEWKADHPEMWKLVRATFTQDVVTGYYTFPDVVTGQTRDKFLAAVRVKGTPFISCASVYIDAFFTPVHDQIRAYESNEVIRADASIKKYLSHTETQIEIISGIILLILTIVCLGIGVWFARSITAPVENLNNGVRRIGAGDLTVQVDEEGPPEIRQLAAQFNNLGAQLTHYIDDLKRETAMRHAIQKELEIAREIQTSLLPHSFPPFPERKEFMLHAQLVPAKEVAGDFFDFFFIDEETLVTVVGDVSDKGVPAALFMAVTRTMIRNTCKSNRDPATVLRRVNKALCEENDACMFVTLFLAYYHVKTGNIICANAGHHQAYGLQEDGHIRSFGMCGNSALGLLENAEYSTQAITLEKNESMIVYTDGITEAHSPEKELYGDDRLKNILSSTCTERPNVLCKSVIDDVTAFQNNNGFDDITILVLRRC